MIEILRLTLFPAMMAFAASSDLLTMTIANRVSLILVAGFVLLASLGGMSVNEMLMHCAVAVAVLLVAFGFFSQGWIGGGDAKLAATTVLWLGVGHLTDYLVYASLLGGGLTLLLIQFRAMPLPPMLTGQDWIERLHDRNGGVPYGIALAAAALMIYPQTEWMGFGF